jgi:hypothetical protein
LQSLLPQLERFGKKTAIVAFGKQGSKKWSYAKLARQTGDVAGSPQLAVQALGDLGQQQAEPLAYFDVFWVAAVLGAGLVFLVLLMKRSVAEKGAHVGAE